MILLSPLLLRAQPGSSPLEKSYFQKVRTAFREQQALQTVGFVEQRWRVAGNTGFNESIYEVEKILKQAGFLKVDTPWIAPPISAIQKVWLTYRIEKRPMKKPTWEPIDAEVKIEGESTSLLSFKTNRNMIAMYSASTPVGGTSAEVVALKGFSQKDFEATDVRGKIVFANGPVGIVYANAMKAGAIGVLAYSMPAYTQPEKQQHSIQFSGIPYKDSAQAWGIILSYAARERLKAALAKGPVKLNVHINTKIYSSEELTIVADVFGTVKPEERFVFSAHVQEPGANDNASGVGTLAEMARVTAELVRSRQFVPKRTLTFLWGDEIVSTRRYIQDDSLRARGIKWGLSLDMVGEDTKKTGGTFLIEKMPDPSAIWTRGNDKHSEWGGSPLGEKDMFPHYFNDLLLNRCRNEAKGNGWVINTNPFEGGSDHTPFLNAKIPGLLMWHFTDVFYHTDQDRLDKVSATTMRHVGVSALVTAYLLTSANRKTAQTLITELTENALDRLRDETALGKANIAKGGNKTFEQQIIHTWQQWYIKALEATTDLAVEGPDASITAAIAKAKALILGKKFNVSTNP